MSFDLDMGCKVMWDKTICTNAFYLLLNTEEVWSNIYRKYCWYVSAVQYISS